MCSLPDPKVGKICFLARAAQTWPGAWRYGAAHVDGIIAEVEQRLSVDMDEIHNVPFIDLRRPLLFGSNMDDASLHYQRAPVSESSKGKTMIMVT